MIIADNILTIDLLNLIFSQIFLVIFGYSILILFITRSENIITLIPSISISYLIGMGVTTFLMSAMSLVNIELIKMNLYSIMLFIITFNIISLFTYLKIKQKPFYIILFNNIQNANQSENKFLVNLLWGVVALKIVVVSLVIISDSVVAVIQEWDALSFYSPAALNFYYEKSITSFDGISNTAYPLHRHLSETYMYISLGKDSDGLATTIYGLIYLSILINTYFFMKCAGISPIISIIITLFLANDIILKSYTLYQNSDLMITAFYSTCCMLFVIYLKNVGKKYLLILSSLFLAMSVWTRGEYPVSIIIFLIVFMVLYKIENKLILRKSIIFFIIPIIITIYWQYAQRYYFGIINNSYMNPANIINIISNYEELYNSVEIFIKHLLFSEFFNLNRWQFNWLIIFALFILGIFDTSIRKQEYIGILIILLHIIILIYGIRYYLTVTLFNGYTFKDVLAQNTARNLLHILPFSFFTAGLIAERIKDKIKLSQ